MAIGLSDLAPKSNIKKERAVLSEAIVEQELSQDKQQRPWEFSNQAEKSSVSLSAVKRAQDIALKHDERARELRAPYSKPDSIQELDNYIEKREEEFSTLKMGQSSDVRVSRIKSKNTFFRRLTSSLFGL